MSHGHGTRHSLNALGCLVLIALGGCTTTTPRGSWGSHAQWPTLSDFGRAAVDAAKDPMTWVPLAGAAVLGLTDLDDDLSEWAAKDRPLFGSDPGDASDTLRDLSTIAYATTALLAPQPSFEDKAKGLAVGIGAIALTEGITNATKSITDRRRPNGRNSASFPSGHASAAAVRASLAVRNLDYMPLSQWADTGLTIGFYGIAAGTAWARVEAEQHHATDALVGFALGNFIARWFHGAFLEAGNEQLAVTFAPAPGGGAMSFHYALGAPP